MGLIERILGFVFAGGKHSLKDAVEVFRENAEASAARDASLQSGALEALVSEFERSDKGAFDRFMDGVNRLPRPAMALGTLGLFVAAMVDPLWFAARMQGIALVPEPLWWLLGVIVSFYFGARYQLKSQDFQRDMSRVAAQLPQVVQRVQQISEMRAETPGVAKIDSDAEATLRVTAPADNPALEHWKTLRPAPAAS